MKHLFLIAGIGVIAYALIQKRGQSSSGFAPVDLSSGSSFGIGVGTTWTAPNGIASNALGMDSRVTNPAPSNPVSQVSSDGGAPDSVSYAVERSHYIRDFASSSTLQ